MLTVRERGNAPSVRGKLVSMASKDKALGRVSDWTTLVMMAGIAMLPLLPGQKIERAASRTQPPAAAAAPAPVASAKSPTGVGPAEVAVPVRPPAAQLAGPATQPVPPPVEDVWTDAQQAAGLRKCLRVLAPIATEVELEVPVKKGPCGMSAPVLLRSVGSSTRVSFSPPPQMNCRLAAQTAQWVETVLQPAAREVLGSRIARIVGASSYSCRNMYSKPDLPLSQHATGSAIDISAFVTADGRTIRVAKAWGPTERDILAAQKKAAEAAAKAAAKKKDSKSTKEDTAAASPEKTKKSSEEAKVHKAGYKTDERPQPPVVATATTLTAAKTRESAFLNRLHSGACTVFGTVLGPEANEAHRDHFHFDVKERKRRGVCH